MRIDADAHVDETEATWDYLGPEHADLRPRSVSPAGDPNQRWAVDGVEFMRRMRDPLRTGVSSESGQLLDVAARVAHLDELRIDLQVLYPTMFLRARWEGHEELEVALCGSYNRWIADRTSQSEGRLRWVALPPMRSMDLAVKEIQWAKEHGAVGVFKKGIEVAKKAGDPYFYPLYEAAEALDMPICVHTGSDGFQEMSDPTALDSVLAFNPLAVSQVHDRFPALRVAFIESGAAWVPFMLSILAASGRLNHLQAINGDFDSSVDLDLFRRFNYFVTVQSQDDLAYLMNFGLEDSLVVGTDYTHSDQSAELRVLDIVEERAAAGVLPVEVAAKMLDDNARRLYGL